MGAQLSHLDESGRAQMVDVAAKAATQRRCTARAHVQMKPQTLAAITAGVASKGDVFAAARLAGIMAAKRSADLIPLCHPLPLDFVRVSLRADAALPGVQVEAQARATARTGVEMEALTAAAIAALTVYDMCKAADRAMVVGGLRLVQKSGGKSGAWMREGETPAAAAPG